MYSRMLMMLCLLTNCYVLAARWHVNGNTCNYKLYRGANCMFVGMHQGGVLFNKKKLSILAHLVVIRFEQSDYSNTEVIIVYKGIYFLKMKEAR